MKRFLSLAAATLLSLLVALPAQAANPTVEVATNQGKIVVELFADKAPASVDNFLQYVKEGFYNGTVFHRVIPDFMVQGGGFTEKMEQKPTRAPVQNEAKNGLTNDRGTLAMARTNDPHSATAQFFINHKDNAFLNYPGRDGWGYAVFGKVTQGMDIVDRIARIATGNAGGHQNVPLQAVVIQNVRIVSDK
jgi:cyclophilin family peptidyl-prolyl cis-trans isomerase